MVIYKFFPIAHVDPKSLEEEDKRLKEGNIYQELLGEKIGGLMKKIYGPITEPIIKKLLINPSIIDYILRVQTDVKDFKPTHVLVEAPPGQLVGETLQERVHIGSKYGFAEARPGRLSGWAISDWRAILDLDKSLKDNNMTGVDSTLTEMSVHRHFPEGVHFDQLNRVRNNVMTINICDKLKDLEEQEKENGQEIRVAISFGRSHFIVANSVRSLMKLKQSDYKEKRRMVLERERKLADVMRQGEFREEGWFRDLRLGLEVVSDEISMNMLRTFLSKGRIVKEYVVLKKYLNNEPLTKEERDIMRGIHTSGTNASLGDRLKRRGYVLKSRANKWLDRNRNKWLNRNR